VLDEHLLTRTFHQLRKDAAVGVDGVSKDEYGQDLAANIRGLHERMKEARYRHQPIRRVHIPKSGGKTRPLGISCIEDKIVQGALTALLSAIYEPVFMECSYGYRPGRSAHDAVKALHGVTGEVTWILEADIEAFFDSIDRKKLMEELRKRIDDESLLRLIGKCLHVGVLEGEAYSEPEVGTAQGSVLSPLLGNV
jgi:group II intron reverse transcriptase/maturase